MNGWLPSVWAAGKVPTCAAVVSARPQDSGGHGGLPETRALPSITSMPLEPFDVVCPEVADVEMRVCEAPGLATLGLPTKYLLREFYCTESGCDCRRVLVQFLPNDPAVQVPATINYGWEKAGYYKKWSSDPELWREMAGATLERMAEQGPHADKFLLVFKKAIEDRTLVAAFRRHYKLVKEITDAPFLPGPSPQDPLG
jgi:hypothetical protein